MRRVIAPDATSTRYRSPNTRALSTSASCENTIERPSGDHANACGLSTRAIRRGVARRQIGDIQSQRSSALVGCEERDARSIGRHTRKRREVRNITHARRLGHTRRTGSKTIAQSQRVVAFGCDPVLHSCDRLLPPKRSPTPAPRETIDPKLPARRAIQAGGVSDPVSVGKVIEEQAAEHIVTVERPGARIRFRLVQVRAVRLEHGRPQRFGEIASRALDRHR